MKKKIIMILIIIVILTSITGVTLMKIAKKEEKEKQKKPTSYPDSSYNLKLMKTVNSTQEKNYLISPYSIEMALSMLEVGTAGTSKEEISSVIPNRSIPDITIKNRIGVANATFIKEEYQPFIKASFMNTLKDDYQAEVILDKFETPDKINDWVSKKTNKMIDKILDEMSKEFVLGIANAIAIDVDWYNQFECIDTSKETFYKEDQTKQQVEMMHNTYSYNTQYFKTDNAKGVILPYLAYDKKGKADHEKGKHLEFIGILPNDNVNTYIENLTEEELNRIDTEKKEASFEKQLKLSLPRFQYDFDLDEFKEVLKAMGIKEVFNKKKANLTNIMSKEDMGKIDATNLYVEKAIHKTHIELNEKGTKAAAVTYFGVEKTNAIAMVPEYIEINFNKPFIYMIRDYETKEILFFGVVREPNTWKGTTCDE